MKCRSVLKGSCTKNHPKKCRGGVMVRKKLLTRMLVLLLIFSMILGMAGCKKDGKTSTDADGTKPATTQEETKKDEGPKDLKVYFNGWTTKMPILIERFNKIRPDVKHELEDINEILKIRREKLEELKESNKDPYEIVRFGVTHYTSQIVNNFDSIEGKDVTLAGRLMSKRGMGKASFCDIQDAKDRIQLYVRLDKIGSESYEDFKKYDIGDIIGVKGEVFKTRSGEISIKAKEVTLLSKSLQPLPEKWHGLKDVDLRYRQRYVDLLPSC
jgi:hypothetical protein